MPESRDRLARPVDLGAAFSRIRDGALTDEPGTQLIPVFGTGWDGAGIGRVNGRRRTSVLGVLVADEEETQFTPPVGRGWGRVGWTPITVRRRGRNLRSTTLAGRENTPVIGIVSTRGRGRGRPMNTSLPAWYPRTPLRDITHISMAMERRRSRLGETEDQRNNHGTALDTRLPHRRRAPPLDNDASFTTPTSSLHKKMKPCPPPSMQKISKILHTVANKPSPNDSEFMTPQKKLLSEIHTVEKEVLYELDKLKRTPFARKAEMEKRVRTLLSMR